MSPDGARLAKDVELVTDDEFRAAPRAMTRDRRRGPRASSRASAFADQAGSNASTRNGLPDPFLILSGAAKITAPVGGN